MGEIKHHDFMQLAIDEMRESRSEHENREDPLVGAVLVDSNGSLLGKAHRGSLRIGDHAEYTLIERLLGHLDLEGSIIYVTLEPCITRSPNKFPCARHIVNARIKKAFIGMVDPNPAIEGRGIEFFRNNNVEVEFFTTEFHEIIKYENQDFINYWLSNPDVEIDIDPSIISHIENEIVENATFSDLSLPLIFNYLELNPEVDMDEMETVKTVLTRRGFLKTDTNGILRPSKGGMILFGIDPQDFLPQVTTKVEINLGNIVTEDINGPILTQIEDIVTFLEKHIIYFSKIEGLKRTKEPQFPKEAVREAVANALIHRDYSGGRKIQISLLADRFIVKSPGLPLNPLTLEKIRKYDISQYSRNPRIVSVFNKMGYVEERGWGIKLMRDILIRNNFPHPEFKFDNGYFSTTFHYQTIEPIQSKFSKEKLSLLNERQKKILFAIEENGSISRKQIELLFGVGLKVARNDIRNLLWLGFIEVSGGGPKTRYKLRMK